MERVTNRLLFITGINLLLLLYCYNSYSETLNLYKNLLKRPERSIELKPAQTLPGLKFQGLNINNNQASKIYSAKVQRSKNLDFECPNFLNLNTPPKFCSTTKPKYPNFSNSNFYHILEYGGNPGPSAQMTAFRHVFMAAALLNKGITISNFSSHYHDYGTFIKQVPFGLRFDMEFFCQFLELKNFEKSEFQTENVLDQVVAVTPGHLADIAGLRPKQIDFRKSYINRQKWGAQKFLRKFTQFPPVDFEFGKYDQQGQDRRVFLPARRFQTAPNQTFRDLAVFFKNQGLDQTKNIGLIGTTKQIFRGTAKLIDDGGNYYGKNPTTGASQPPEFSVEEAKQELSTDKNLVYESLKATIHPKFIRQLARNFVKNFFKYDPGLLTLENQDTFEIKNHFIGVHFRFNPNDFFNKNFLDDDYEINHGKRAVSKEMLIKIRESIVNPESFLDLLTRHIKQSGLGQENKIIYIASPSNIAKNFQKFKNYSGFEIFTSEHVNQFLTPLRKQCATLDRYYGEILSLVEKELMVISRHFYRCRPSNWSFNQLGYRAALMPYEKIRDDKVIFDVFR